MKKIWTIGYLLGSAFTAAAQDDLLNMMQNESTAKPVPVYATFKSTRVINLQSNETMKAKHLDFRIQHRFSPFDFSAANNYGFYNFLGLDGAKIRLGLEYGITDRVMVGIGRTNLNNFYDGFVKVKLLEQTKGSGSFPVSVTYFGNTGITALEFTDKTRDNLFTSRLSYVHQLIITRKFNDYISMLLSPTLVHHNLVPDKSTPNDVLALGIGFSFRLTRSTRFNIEYIPRLTGRDQPVDQATQQAMYYDAIAVGFDIETGGHVFQLHFTNATGLAEQQVIAENTNKIDMRQIRFGFNISRTFSFDREHRAKKP